MTALPATSHLSLYGVVYAVDLETCRARMLDRVAELRVHGDRGGMQLVADAAGVDRATLRRFFEPKATIKYPETPATIPHKFRGRLQLLYDECPGATPFNSWEWLFSWWQAYGGARQLRARVHPGRAAGERMEHDADGGAARHRAEPPVPEDQGLQHQPAPIIVVEDRPASSPAVLALLRELTALPGPSGHEREVALAYAKRLHAFTDEVRLDPFGNVIAVLRGTDARGSVMVSAHLDEVGLVVKHVEDDGMLRIDLNGLIDERVLLAAQVDIWTRGGRLPGVVGARSRHHLTPDELRRPIETSDLWIAVGADSAADEFPAAVRDLIGWTSGARRNQRRHPRDRRRSRYRSYR